METKINHSDLSALFAKETGISLAKAELLTKAFFDLIIEGLEQDGIVKINSLGTFRITDVASRSSVNVNTGEKFEIKGHGKLTFVPADTLKEAVNQPFAMFEPVEVDETYSDDTLAEDEEKEDTAEQEVPAAATVEAVQVEVAADELPVPAFDSTSVEEEMPAEESVAEAPVRSFALNAIEEEIPAEECAEECNTRQFAVNVVEEEVPAVEAEEEPAAAVPVEEPVAEDTGTEVEEEKPVAEALADEKKPVGNEVKRETVKHMHEASATEEKQGSKKRGALWTILIFVIAIILIGINRFMLAENGADEALPVDKERTETVAAVQEQPSQPVAEIAEAAPETVEVETPASETSEAVADDVAAADAENVYEFVVTEELAALNLKNITIADTTLYFADGQIAIHKVAGDETLTKVALKYFGDKKLWPYIVKYNNLEKPNDLCKGMELVIPRLKPRK